MRERKPIFHHGGKLIHKLIIYKKYKEIMESEESFLESFFSF